MATKVMTSIYLTRSQKQALNRRARQRRTTVSEEIRGALDRHLKNDSEGDELQLSVLAEEAHKSIERMIQKLDETHSSLTHLRKSLSRRKS